MTQPADEALPPPPETSDEGEAPNPSQPIPTPSGVLIIDKQPGFTSMDVCAIIRARFRRGGAPKRLKVGHGGTLDPAATGVLVVLVGKATPLCNIIMAGEKEYTATLDLAHTSTTDDAEGALEPITDLRTVTRDELLAILPRFTGTIAQRPPNFSAMNVGGVRAYQLAREGKAVPLTERNVDVHALELLDFAFPSATLKVRTGKGFYVRSLARDLGRALSTAAPDAPPNVGGMLTALRRTRVGRFFIDHAKTLDQLPPVLTQADLLPIESLGL